MKIKFFMLMVVVFVFVALGFYTQGDFLFVKKQQQKQEVIENYPANVLPTQETSVEKSKDVAVRELEEVEVVSEMPIGNVPFVSQAPTGEWSDKRFQNGCEEASIMMAYAWVTGKTYSKDAAKKEIIDLWAFEEKTVGSAVDTSVEDTALVMKKYFNYEKVSVKKDPTLDDIKKELVAGKLVLVPAFGRALKNPNFTSPGPITHMLVLKGYDKKTNTFVTNDPGTRKGEGFVYDAQLLFEAIWAYASGAQHPDVPDIKNMKKAYIVVNR